MKKMYLKSLLSLLLLFVGMNAWGDTATFDFTSNSTATTLGVTPSTTKSTGVSIDGKSITVNTITCSFDKNGGNAPVFFTKSDAASYQVRVYVNNIITISAPTGYNITALSISGSNLTATTYITASTGTYGGSATAATWTGEANTVVLTCAKSTPQINTIEVTFSAATSVSAPTFSLSAGNYVDEQSVELSCSTEGATIYYTTDGTTPTNTSTTYTSAIKVSTTTTINAIAYKDGAASNVATATYNFLTPYTSLSAAHNDATTTATDCAITFNDVLVTAVTSNNAYIMDGAGNAAVIYASGHGFAAGDKINGTAIGKMQTYQTHALEFTGITSSSTGLEITSGTVTPVEKALSEISLEKDICKLIKVTGVNITTTTYTANTTQVTDGTNSALLYNTFNAIGDMNFSTEAKYTITGIIPAYKTLEIAPRTAADVVCNLVAPEVSFANATVQVAYDETSVDANELTNNAGTPTYTSSNPEVATVDPSTGVVTLVAPGLTTITATTAETSTYLAGTASYNLLYLSGDGSEEHPYNAIDLNNATGISGTVWVSGKILGSGANNATGLAASYAKTNVVLGDCTIAEATKETTIPVSVYSNLQKVLDLTSDATVLNKEIKVCGAYNSSYYGRCGINSNASQKISGLAEDLSVSSVGYATYYDATAWIVPAGLTVKYVSAVDNGVLTWKEYEEGATVPANTGVVVSGDEADYPITYIGSGTAAPTNCLYGTLKETELDADADYYFYGLSLNSAGEASSVGFYWMAADGAAFTNGAHKAYLKVAVADAQAAKSAFVFNDDEGTGINAVETVNAETGAAYNLAGQRVNANVKGLVIKNGKKFINK